MTTVTATLRSLFILPAAFTLAPFAACSPGSVTGEVDGDVVPAFRSAVAYELKDFAPNGDYAAVVAFYTFPGGCDLVSEWNDTRADALEDAMRAETEEQVNDASDDVIDWEQDNLPDDYWAAYAFLSDDEDDDLHGHKYDVEDDAVDVVICHHKGETDPLPGSLAALVPDFLINRGDSILDDNTECFSATDGEIRVPQFDPGESAAVKAPVEIEAADGDDAGDVELGGVAPWCDAVEDPVEDMVNLLLGT